MVVKVDKAVYLMINAPHTPQYQLLNQIICIEDKQFC